MYLVMRRLTVGAAIGSIRDLFAKVKAIDAKHGKFDLVLCTGDFFGPIKDTEVDSEDSDETTQLLDGAIEGTLLRLQLRMHSQLIAFLSFVAPIECYIMQGEYPLPSRVVEKFAKTGGELCKNVFLISTCAQRLLFR